MLSSKFLETHHYIDTFTNAAEFIDNDLHIFSNCFLLLKFYAPQSFVSPNQVFGICQHFIVE